jgi:hypothetical protein
MVPYFRNMLFGHPLIVTMTKAATKQAVNIPFYSILIKGLVESLTRAKVIEKES